MTPLYTIFRLLSGHETAPITTSLSGLWVNSISLHCFHAYSKALKQHCFMPSSQAFGHETALFYASLSDHYGSLSFITMREPKYQASGVKPIIHLDTHIVIGLHTLCLGLKPIGWVVRHSSVCTDLRSEHMKSQLSVFICQVSYCIAKILRSELPQR